MKSSLTEDQIKRYQRQLILPEIGPAGQKRLLAGSVCIVGVGGLGSPAALYTAGAGCGHIILIDNDKIALDNLHRQIIYTREDIGMPKAEVAGQALHNRNPELHITKHAKSFTAANSEDLLEGADIVIDATDNFAARFALADACHALRIPYVHAGVQRFYGQCMTVIPGNTTCYRCIFPQPPPPDSVPSCAATGILGPVAGFFGTVQACEAIKYLTGAGDLLTNQLLTANLLDWTIRITPKRRQPACPLCGE